MKRIFLAVLLGLALGVYGCNSGGGGGETADSGAGGADTPAEVAEKEAPAPEAPAANRVRSKTTTRTCCLAS